MAEMQSRPYQAIPSQPNAVINVDNTSPYGGTCPGTNFILKSAFLRMTLVATSTVITVTAFALLAIGLSELLTQGDDDGRRDNGSTEPMVLAVAGILLLITSSIQFICICVWSGWCILLPRQGFRILDPHQNQMVINNNGRHLVTVPSGACYELEPSVKDKNSPSMLTSNTDRPIKINRDGTQFLYADQLTPSPATSTVVDASTSTRGDLHHLPSRIYNSAPMALQEEITPSLRSSFQSFDDII